MIIAVIGLSHKTASLALRERLALNTEDLPNALAYLSAQAGNGVILSTCNRTELYFIAGPGQASHAAALRLLAGATGASIQRMQKRTYFYLHHDAIRHLHRVASGLDSMIFGEVEILGQVRSAFQASAEAGLSNAVLSRLFHSAIRCGRRVHAETFISHHDRSVASAAVNLAHGVFGELPGRRVMVLGAGEAGTLAIRSLARAGARNVVIANRTYRRAAELARHLKAEPVPLSQVPHLLSEIDIVISASGAASPLISKDALVPAMLGRQGRPILLVDISVPRNIDPVVRSMPGVHLYDVDDLRQMCPAGPDERERELARAEEVMEEEVQRFLAWWRSLRAVPTIVALQRRVEEARQREMAKTLRRYRCLDERERDGLEALTKAIIKKVLHQPITRLKLHSDDQDYVAVTREIFGLDIQDVAPKEPPR